MIPEQNNPVLKDWSIADVQWLEGTVPIELRHVAQRHGRFAFSLVMQAGTASYSLGLIQKRTGGNRELTQALHILSTIMNDLVQCALQGKGKTLQEFAACKADVELVGTMAAGAQTEQPGVKKSPGGIILNS